MYESIVRALQKTSHVSVPKFNSANEVVKSIAVDSKN
jgi:hypothetical protein